MLLIVMMMVNDAQCCLMTANTPNICQLWLWSMNAGCACDDPFLSATDHNDAQECNDSEELQAYNQDSANWLVAWSHPKKTSLPYQLTIPVLYIAETNSQFLSLLHLCSGYFDCSFTHEIIVI